MAQAYRNADNTVSIGNPHIIHVWKRHMDMMGAPYPSKHVYYNGTAQLLGAFAAITRHIKEYGGTNITIGELLRTAPLAAGGSAAVGAFLNELALVGAACYASWWVGVAAGSYISALNVYNTPRITRTYHAYMAEVEKLADEIFKNRQADRHHFKKCFTAECLRPAR